MTDEASKLADRLEALAYISECLAGAEGSRDADCGYVTGNNFQMMTMCPDPERLAGAINSLPEILTALRTHATLTAQNNALREALERTIHALEQLDCGGTRVVATARGALEATND